MVACVPVVGWAGRYPTAGVQTFTTAAPSTNLGDGSVVSSSNSGTDGNPAAVVLNNALRLTQLGTLTTQSSFKLPDLDPGQSVQSWDIALKLRMTTTGTPAEGWSLNVGPVPAGNGDGEGGFVMPQGLVIAFDTYNNGGDPPGIKVRANGVLIGNFPQTFSFDTTFRPLTVHWDGNGLDLTYTVAGSPVVVCTNLPTPGYVPRPGHTFALSARTSVLSQDTLIDDLLVTTVPLPPVVTGGPVISEFCADNAQSLEDENADSSDWIELYNGQATPIDLGGWHLTNDPVNRNQWMIPNVSLPAYGYLVIFASGKNRSDQAHPLHTNFSLQREAGYLALVRPGGAELASEFVYGEQVEDISYGLMPSETGLSYGFLESPSPGERNTGYQATGPPAEEVVFLRNGQPTTGGVFGTAFTLTLQPPTAPGSVIRYTLDNSLPTAASPIFPSSLAVADSTTIRARVFTPDRLPGSVSSRTFLRLDNSLTNYHGSGQPFSSNLPIIVLDSFGVPVDSYTSPSQPRPFRLTYAVAIDLDPLAPAPQTKRAQITGPADFQGRSGTHVRGESSATFPQKSYAWETWDNNDQDKDASMLGFPADSDWVLHAPYSDKTLMRNYLAYDQMRALSGKAAAMGVKFVEVFFNQDGGPVSEDDYRGVYVLIEKIKRDGSRVPIEKLNSLMTDPEIISGGYIFKKDKFGIDNTSFNTATFGQTFQFVDPETPNTAQLNWLSSHLNNFETVLASPQFAHPTNGYAGFIDPLSFIDNQWFVEMTKQVDGYRLSTYFYKARNGRITCAPIWDYNLALYNVDNAAGDIHDGWFYKSLNRNHYYYWPRLHQDPDFKVRHWDRYWELRRGRFATNSILTAIDDLASELVNGSSTIVTNTMAELPPLSENPAMRHFRKWPILGTYTWPNPGNPALRTKFWNGPSLNPASYTTADGEVDAMKDFLRQRLAWIDDQHAVGTVIYRPPVLSREGGSVPMGTTLGVSRHTGTAPAGFSYASGGTLYYSLNGTDPRPDTGHASEVVLLNGNTNLCQWLVPSSGNGGLNLTAAAGAQQWTGITVPSNFAQWTNGSTGVGYERDVISGIHYSLLIGQAANVGTPMYGKNATCYIRVPFSIPDQATLNAINSLRLGMRYDDGFRAYINGTVVAGRNDTDPSLSSSPGTAKASAGHEDSLAVDFESLDITAAGRAALRVGENILAIHGLNEAANSDDFLICPRLSYWTNGEAGVGQVYTGPITLTSSAQVRARLFANGQWSPITSADFVVGAAPASAQNLVISEFCYRPLAPAPGTPEYEAGFTEGNDFEYLEVMNISGQPVDLTGCQLTTGVTFDFGGVAPEKLTLMPGERALVVGNESAFLLRYGSALAPRVLGAFSGNLSNEGETITLLAANGSIIASVTYGVEDPWPTAAAELGYSLTLNNPSPDPPYGAGAFRPSAESGGTPGVPSGPTFTGDPNADTDGDGLQDLLEFALGTNSSSAASAAIPNAAIQELTIGGVTAPYFTFTHRRNDAVEGVTCHIELSTGLQTWSSSPVTLLNTVTNGDGTSTVTWRTTEPATGPNRQLMRLRVSQPTE
jgi:hypothetical protein